MQSRNLSFEKWENYDRQTYIRTYKHIDRQGLLIKSLCRKAETASLICELQINQPTNILNHKAAIAPVCISQKWGTPQTCQFVPEEPKGKILNSAFDLSLLSQMLWLLTTSFIMSAQLLCSAGRIFSSMSKRTRFSYLGKSNNRCFNEIAIKMSF